MDVILAIFIASNLYLAAPEQICGKRLCYGKRVGSKWLGVLNKLFNTDFLALDKKIPAFLKGLKLVVLNASVHDGTY